MIDIQIIPILKDNYAYLLQSPCGKTAIIDPGEAEPIINLLDQKRLRLDYILNTHHHWDHTNGNKKLKHHYGAQIVAPEKEAANMTEIDITLKEGDIFELGSEGAQIIECPGHTLGGVCFYFENNSALFTGDFLFSMGCGRLFEGTAEQMYNSFQKVMMLPDNTMIYCGHEYTRGNAGFCLAHDKDNEDLKKRIEEVKLLRANDKPTIPVSLGVEKKTNIFLMAQSADEFAALRIKKDNF